MKKQIIKKKIQAFMLKRLKSQLFMSEVQKQLEKAKITKTHQFVQPRQVILITNFINIPKSKNQLLNNLYKKMRSSDITLKIKTLVVLHACVRRSFDDDVCQVIMNQEAERQVGSPRRDQKDKMEAYIHQNVIQFYLLYLKKLCMNKESFLYIKKFTRKEMYTENCETEELQHEENIQIVTHGFKILNLCNYILQSQQMFNKMGRYHIEYEQILSMYMQFLQDLNLFNNYIKNSVRIILDRYNQTKNSMAECIRFLKLNNENIEENSVNLNKNKKDKNLTSTTKAQTSNIVFDDFTSKGDANQIQEIKHYFLYVNECQKLSDRLYEYYHNRYYYKVLKSLIIFPTFLTVQNKEYARMKNRTKKIDRNLVRLVKNSKYEGETSMITDSFKTQPNIGGKNSLNRTLSYARENYTQIFEPKEDYDPYQNITHNFITEKMQQTIQDY